MPKRLRCLRSSRTTASRSGKRQRRDGLSLDTRRHLDEGVPLKVHVKIRPYTPRTNGKGDLRQACPYWNDLCLHQPLPELWLTLAITWPQGESGGGRRDAEAAYVNGDVRSHSLNFSK
jgi:hypothetical protein